MNRTVPHGANLEQDPENKTGQPAPSTEWAASPACPTGSILELRSASAGREPQAGAAGGQAAAAQGAPSVAVLPQDVRAAPAAGRLV